MRATCSAMSMWPRSKFLQNTSNEDKVVGILWRVWGYWSIEAGSCVDILCHQLDTTRDVDLRLPMATCHQKDHTRSTLHGDWVRSLGHWSLLILRIPMPPCTCTATTHLDTKRSSSHRRCSRHGMWCLLILNYGMRSDVGQCMIHGHQVDKP